jgi:aspartyl-tRNA(Asn)/glutamyl-tRNA(Gln) amidotransferase subunit A
MTSYLTMTEALGALESGEVSSVELVRQALAVADAVDDRLGAFVSRFDETGLRAAERADSIRRAGASVGRLHGIPVGIKDILTTEDGPTTAQSRVRDPGGLGTRRADATAVRRLRDAGAIVLGKLSTMEFAVGMPDPGGPFPVPRNPWDLSRWAGGSSSGSGSAVAVGSVLGALGTDTAASIRMPAAFCGVTGLKPTYGLVPRTGCIPLAHTLDHVGPLARSAEDCELMLAVIAGHDPADVGSVVAPAAGGKVARTGRLDGVRVGFDRLDRVETPRRDGLLDEVLDRALRTLEDLGAEIVPLELPLYGEVAAAAQVILLSEAFTHHRRALRDHWSSYGPSTRYRVGTGALLSAGDYVDAQRVARVAARRLANRFDDVDLIVTPTAGRSAPRISEIDGQSGAMDLSFPLYTAYWNLMGNPAISVPMGRSTSGLPLALQIVGKPFRDADALSAAIAYQTVTDWHLSVPCAAGGET